jgi:hypothetical protein
MYEPNPIAKFKNPEDFIEDKVRMLQEHFKIQLTTDDLTYLKKFKTENDINAAVRTIISRHW